ncbi:short chain dehydrogenase [Fonsecaea erecta]|uniref:Short chain dehydrogenase n=1 Tax=Fonsecaea erecta TaxID=1367422 RepID=A0A178ZE46_9EURO|nr:short chain dehydrogenase [Fonsecaea erecta]OAP57932.1 short chain dehydrogenase [Fonsecaea erecta]
MAISKSMSTTSSEAQRSPQQTTQHGFRTVFEMLRALATTKPLTRSFAALGGTRGFKTAPLADGDLSSVRSKFTLSGKNYVITGGGRGIGYAAARAIAEFGGNISILDAGPEPVKDFANLEREFGVKTKYLRTDVANEASLIKAFEETIADFKTLDGCVTAAGICPEGPFVDHTWDQVRKCFDVNIGGTYFSAQLATKYILDQGTGGSIVLIASISGHCATPGHRLSAYNASKGAVKMLGTALSVELGPSNIRVNSISPGYTDTEMLTPLKQKEPKRIELMNKEPPMNRIGTRNDLAPAIIYLLSDASLYTTGADIVIDGGLHSGRIRSPFI